MTVSLVCDKNEIENDGGIILVTLSSLHFIALHLVLALSQCTMHYIGMK